MAALRDTAPGCGEGAAGVPTTWLSTAALGADPSRPYCLDRSGLVTHSLSTYARRKPALEVLLTGLDSIQSRYSPSSIGSEARAHSRPSRLNRLCPRQDSNLRHRLLQRTDSSRSHRCSIVTGMQWVQSPKRLADTRSFSTVFGHKRRINDGLSAVFHTWASSDTGHPLGWLVDCTLAARQGTETVTTLPRERLRAGHLRSAL